MLQKYRLGGLYLAFVRSLLLSCCLLAVPARADIVPGLYAAVVPVAGQDTNSLARASREALSIVLVKVSGSPQALDNPVIKDALGKARQYVQQYSYRREPEGGMAVRLEFDRNRVTSLVAEAGVPLWTANRPGVLVWMVLDSAEGTQFLGTELTPEPALILRAEFDRRGVPLRLPLLDLADAAALSPTDVRRADVISLQAASARYDLEHIVAGRLTQLSTGEYVGDWTYIHREQRLDRQVSAADLATAMRGGVDLAASAMASRYAAAPLATEGSGVLMSVSGVNDYWDCAAVVGWLQSLELIDAARVERVQGDRLELRLGARAELAQLPAIIELNEGLQPAELAQPGVQLSYQWLK